MFKSLFPITENWSWLTFILYYIISISVVLLCKKGAKREEQNVIDTCSSHNGWNLYYFFAVVILTLLATIRSELVGTDTRYYVREFLDFSEMSYNWKDFFSFHQTEPGFQLLYGLLRKITTNYTVLFLVVYSFVSFAYVHFVKYFFTTKSSYTFLILFIYFYVANMSGMRAAIGCAFLLFSFVALAEKKYSQAVLLTILGCMFHYSMMFNLYTIIVYCIFKSSYLKKKRSLWIIGIIVAVGVSYAGMYALKGMLAGTKYDFYASVAMEDVSFLGSLFYVLFGIVALLIYKVIMNENHSKKTAMLIVSLAFLMAYPAIFVVGAYRIPNYYAMPRLFIWSEGVKIFKERKIKESQRIVIDIFVHIILVIYLLFRFTRTSVDGGFIYYLK